MAFNFLLSSSMNVRGSWIGAPEQARFCSFNGYITQVFVIQTDYWVLTIAVYTYFVLTGASGRYLIHDAVSRNAASPAAAAGRFAAR